MVAFVAALVTLGFLFHQSKTLMSTIKEREDPALTQVHAPMCDNTEEERFRVRFGAGPGGLVQGWPSKGGVYILDNCFGLELDFLKLDRFHSSP